MLSANRLSHPGGNHWDHLREPLLKLGLGHSATLVVIHELLGVCLDLHSLFLNLSLFVDLLELVQGAGCRVSTQGRNQLVNRVRVVTCLHRLDVWSSRYGA